MKLPVLAAIAALSMFAACAGAETETDAAELGTASQAASTGQKDNGTELTASTVSTGAPVCTLNDAAQIEFSGLVSTTGSVDSVEITASVDGGPAGQVGVILPQEFEHAGRNKVAAYAVMIEITNGTHTVEFCFTQSGEQGRLPKTTCAAPVTVVVECAAQSVCANVQAFGDIVSNPNLCKGKGPPHIPVHVKGDFGDSAALTITGPNGFTHSATLRHAGDSCVYQYNWDAAANGGAGTYTFDVVGENGATYSFAAQLHCN